MVPPRRAGIRWNPPCQPTAMVYFILHYSAGIAELAFWAGRRGTRVKAKGSEKQETKNKPISNEEAEGGMKTDWVEGGQGTRIRPQGRRACPCNV